jgi:hypothetical protein
MTDTAKPKAKRRKSVTVEDPGVRVRVYKRGDTYWFDVRLDKKRRKRVSSHTNDRTIAESRARELAKAIGEQRGQAATKTDAVTLGEIFRLYHDLYRDDAGRAPAGQWKKAAVTRTAAFLAAWGRETPVVSISQTSVGKYCDERQRAWRAKRKDEKATLRPGALDCDFRWLSSVFNWGTRHKLADGSRLLSLNPLHDCNWPREKDPRRPRSSQERFLATMNHADAVDPSGRLRAILALARYTARRVDAICHLRASDVLLSRDRVVAALAAGGKDIADADHMPHGGIRWSAESDKQGMLHVTAISADARAALERYLAANPRLGDVPLFPSVERKADGPEVPLSRSTATKWLARAERLAELPKLAGGVWHPYRRLWATERQHIADVSVAAGGGWKSTKTLKLYQGVMAANVLDAVLNAKPSEPTPNEGTPKAQSGS